MPTSKKRVTFALRMPVLLEHRLRELAARRHVTRSDLVREFVRKGVEAARREDTLSEQLASGAGNESQAD